MLLFSRFIETPIGEMFAAATDNGICIFDFYHRRMMNSILSRVEAALDTHFIEDDHPHIETLQKEIFQYFDGSRKDFEVPLHLIGSPFQLKVWHGLQQIPYSETRSYKQQSKFLGDEKAIRAVARANGENGIAIIIPCHRVIGENGSLIGYGGGLWRKQWLLNHEKKHAGKTLQQSLF
jgi:O-6-methylguanine DNA methyltransferase